MDPGIWNFIDLELSSGRDVIFLCVVESIGSSPGRQGFKMAVGNSMAGSIGGGMMEHKLVELAKTVLKNHRMPFIKRQIHLPEEAADRSGMICSGEQTVSFSRLTPSEIMIIKTIQSELQSGRFPTLVISNSGIKIEPTSPDSRPFEWNKKSEEEWSYSEILGWKPHIHIFGGGHVSLAFSKLMRDLNFTVSVYDDREDLHTMQLNSFADEKQLIRYDEIREKLKIPSDDWIVIMTFGYRCDGVVLRQLINTKFRYLGVLGSQAKIEKMWSELKAEGVSEDVLNAIHAPVGIQVFSQTPEEIAVSIAAEIIREKNKPVI